MPTTMNGKMPIAVICHPHPLYGGTMDNKVVITLMRTYLSLNIPVIRFNFRGVGSSGGKYADGEGEQMDLRIILKWLLSSLGETVSIALAGFSFGSFVAAQVAQDDIAQDDKLPLHHLVLVAPPVNFSTEGRSAFIFPKPSDYPNTFPIFIVQGEEDEIINLAEVRGYCDAMSTALGKRVKIMWMSETGHFFHKQLITLQKRLQTLLIQQLDD